MKDPGKTGYSLFVVSILILIVNDWYLKAAFHNGLTGKLSDFAGLFAFPFLLSLLLPKHKLKIHSGTILLFIFWKSQYAEIPIDIINRIGIPVQRVADPTDNIALLSVLLSYFLVNDRIKYGIKPIFQKSVILFSGLAFMATTLPPGSNKKFVDIDQDYHFDFSKRELVSRLNMVQLREIRKVNKHNRQVDFNPD